MEMSLLGWFGTVLMSHHPPDDVGATGQTILRLISPCPACGKQRVKAGDAHQYALLASEIAREDSQELSYFFQLYKDHSWAELNQIQNFDGRFNAALIYVVRCDRGITVLAVRSPEEFWDSDSLLDAVVLDDRDAAAINSLPLSFETL
jgi:hypothetical protein